MLPERDVRGHAILPVVKEDDPKKEKEKNIKGQFSSPGVPASGLIVVVVAQKNLHSIGVHLGPDVELVVLEVGADLLEEPLRLGLEVLDLLVRGAPRLELRGQVLEVAYKFGRGGDMLVGALI